MSVAPPVEKRRDKSEARFKKRRRDIARASGRRRLRRVLIAMAAAGVLVLGIVVVHSPLFSARRIVIIGAHHTTRAEVLKATGLFRHPPLIDISPGADEAALRALPFVATATVTREWFSSVRITLTERVPVAAVRAGEGKFVELDDHGRVLEVVSRAPSGLVAVRVSSPLPAPGQQVPQSEQALFTTAGALPENLLSAVSYFDLSSKDGPLAHLSNGDQAIFGSTADLAAKMEALATVLARVHLVPGESIDLRIPSSPVLTP